MLRLFLEELLLPPFDKLLRTCAMSSALACSKYTTWICARDAGSTSTSRSLINCVIFSRAFFRLP